MIIRFYSFTLRSRNEDTVVSTVSTMTSEQSPQARILLKFWWSISLFCSILGDTAPSYILLFWYLRIGSMNLKFQIRLTIKTTTKSVWLCLTDLIAKITCIIAQAIVWYSFPYGCGFRLILTHDGQYSLVNDTIDSSKHVIHDGLNTLSICKLNASIIKQTCYIFVAINWWLIVPHPDVAVDCFKPSSWNHIA